MLRYVLFIDISWDEAHPILADDPLQFAVWRMMDYKQECRKVLCFKILYSHTFLCLIKYHIFSDHFIFCIFGAKQSASSEPFDYKSFSKFY